MRSFASGFGIFGIMMLIGMAGMLFRGREAAQKMSWGELRQYRANYFARQDDVLSKIEVQRRAQFDHREHFHWDPAKLVAAVGTERMWVRSPSSDEFGEVRVGVGKVKLAMTIEKPKIPEASRIEPATGHALRKFLLEQEYIDDMAKVIWLQRFAGVSFIGDMDEARAHAAGDGVPAGGIPQPRRPPDSGGQRRPVGVGLDEVAATYAASQQARRLR